MRLRRLRLASLSVSVLALATLVSAQATQTTPPGRETSAASVAAYTLAQQMPVDPEAVVGVLPNGLRYYVRPNGKPARRVELRLVVKAGSVLEDNDQQGLAHFVEHMEFEGTRHFPGRGITDFLSTLGLSIGADANAGTSYDDTQYTLRVPSDAPGALDTALSVLEDWTQAATFDQAGIDRQRGIVLSEWRMHLGAGERTGDRIRRAQLEGSRYADRSPIGKPENIQNAQRDQLLRFYRDWYRPDLMAVIVVGDINPQAVVAKIKERFTPLTNPAKERPRPAYDVPEQPGTRFAIVTDRETTATTVEITNLRPARNQGSVGGYRDLMVDQLFSAMLGARLDELGQSANAPFLRAAADRSLFQTPRTKDEAVVQALVSNDGVTRGLEAMLLEIQRVERFGFTSTELERAKQAMMLGYERAAAESPDRESASRADEYTRNFLQGEALPTIWQELALHRRFVPEITLAELNKLTADWFPDQNRLVVVSAPEAAGIALPDRAQLEAVVKAAAAKKVDAYTDAAAGQKLMDAPPAAGTIVKTTERPSGITEWTLSNGATVVLKPTKLKEDQVLFRASAPGGTSLASDADIVSARIADGVVTAGGVGQFSGVVLDRMLSGKAIAVRPFIDDVDQGMDGGSTPQDLETMFQLLYLRFTQPRADPNAFAAMASQARGLLANQMASPEVVFRQTLDTALTQNHKRRQPQTPATVDQWNLDKGLAFYRARFADASNFTFVFVGSFTLESIRPMIETYVASLPATHARETWRDEGVTTPAGVIEKTIQQGIAPKSQVAIVFSGPFQYDEPHRLAFRAMSLVLQSRLLDAIREELGGTYSITATPDATKYPKPTYTVRIQWTCDPARTTQLVQRVFSEIEEMKNTPLARNQLFIIRDVLTREFENNSQDNAFVLNQISQRYEDGESASVANALNPEPGFAALTDQAIRQAAQYLNTQNYVKVTLMPTGK